MVITKIDEEYLDASLKDTMSPEFFKVITRKPTTYRGGIPFQVEAAVAYGGGAGRRGGDGTKLEIMRFANKTPLLFDSGACAINKAIKAINWKNYNNSSSRSNFTRNIDPTFMFLYNTTTY